MFRIYNRVLYFIWVFVFDARGGVAVKGRKTILSWREIEENNIIIAVPDKRVMVVPRGDAHKTGVSRVCNYRRMSFRI